MADSAHSTPAPRRDFLKLFGVAALPPGVIGAVSFADKTDMTVIQAARKAARLKAAHADAKRRHHECEDAFAAIPLAPEPPKPDTDRGRKAVSQSMVAVLCQFPVITPEVNKAVAELRQRTVQEMWETYRAWLLQWESAAQASGLNDAEFAYDQTSCAEVEAVKALAETKATTLDGLLAKALIFEEDPNDDQLDTHQQALALSLMRDLQAMARASVIV